MQRWIILFYRNKLLELLKPFKPYLLVFVCELRLVDPS